MKALRGICISGSVVSLFAAGFALCSPGCARLAEHKAEDKLNAVLPQYLGPADRYVTRIHAASAGAVLRGRLQDVRIEGTGVRLLPTLLLDDLTLTISDVTVDAKAGTLSGVGSAAFSCRVAAENLDRYVRSRRTGIPDLSVGFNGNRLLVRARPEVLTLGVPVSVEGALTPRAGGTQLDFEPDRARVTIIPIPTVVLDYLSRRLNPAVDLTGLPLAIHVQRAEIDNGLLILSGTVAPDDLLKAASGATGRR